MTQPNLRLTIEQREVDTLPQRLLLVASAVAARSLVLRVAQGPRGPAGPGTGAPVNLVDAVTVAVDASLGKLFRVTLGGNRTLGNPTNLTDGQMLMFEIKQDAAGGRTLALGSKYHFGEGFPGPIEWSTAPNKTDRLLVHYVQDRDQLDVTGFKEGF